MRYTFSEKTVIEFFGIQFYSIKNAGGKVVAYSQKVWDIPDNVTLEGQCLVFEKAKIRGGVIRGGVIRGGVYEFSLLQIQGSRHFCYATPTDLGGIKLGIGCKIHTIDFWIENFEAIGEAENYSELEISEYKQYIDLYAMRYLK